MTGPERSEGEPFDAVDVIRTKRDGGRLSDQQVDWVLDALRRYAATRADEPRVLPDGHLPIIITREHVIAG